MPTFTSIVWASVFGLGGYLLGEGVHRIAAPIGWTTLTLALLAGLALWHFFKSHVGEHSRIQSVMKVRAVNLEMAGTVF